MIAKLDLGKGKIIAGEFNYTFGNENGGLGKAELLGAMLHMGNESNLRKLLVGRGWAVLDENKEMDTAKWDTFIQRMIDEGVLTKADFDFLQSVWDMTEEMKPLAQKAHKEIYGYYFNEVEAVRSIISLARLEVDTYQLRLIHSWCVMHNVMQN